MIQLETPSSHFPNITILGANGRMGRLLVKAVLENPEVKLTGAIVRSNSIYIGEDASSLCGLEPSGVLISDTAPRAVAESQAVIDFSLPEALADHANLALQSKAVYVCGTTGLTSEHEKILDSTACDIPVVWSANMSLGINLMSAIVEMIAQKLTAETYDIDILEMHHRFKEDAPSGTALMLGKAAAKGRNISHDEWAQLSREGRTGARKEGSIGYATLRGGGVIGEHSVIYASPDDRIEIIHKSANRSLYAQGALKAALWGIGKPPGRYSMMDVLDL